MKQKYHYDNKKLDLTQINKLNKIKKYAYFLNNNTLA